MFEHEMLVIKSVVFNEMSEKICTAIILLVTFGLMLMGQEDFWMTVCLKGDLFLAQNLNDSFNSSIDKSQPC